MNYQPPKRRFESTGYVNPKTARPKGDYHVT
ncbi:hypothetical protein MHK_009843 [Candidatus Magnetomorum sp. HK-1]|nr:hypothetical protein MHK_009843 [Candidatus Magnetomorum sp. HK-1]